MPLNHEKGVQVALGDGVAVIRREGRSRATVATILGCESGADGEVTRVYLDRLVHRPHESVFAEWAVSGAVSSILTRHSPPSATAEG
jgi:hypothetical protein